MSEHRLQQGNGPSDAYASMELPSGQAAFVAIAPAQPWERYGSREQQEPEVRTIDERRSISENWIG